MYLKSYPRSLFVLPRSLNAVQRDLDNMLNQVFSGGNCSADGCSTEQSQAQFTYAPMSLWEEDNSWHVELDLPGVKPEDVDVSVEDGVLKVVAERKEEKADRKYARHERSFGRFERAITLPDHADENAIGASFEQGVLRLTIGRKPEVQPKKIAIQAK